MEGPFFLKALRKTVVEEPETILDPSAGIERGMVGKALPGELGVWHGVGPVGFVV